MKKKLIHPSLPGNQQNLLRTETDIRIVKYLMFKETYDFSFYIIL